MTERMYPKVVVDDAESARRRRGRSWAILIALAGLCLLFYAISIVKMTHS